MAVDDVADVVAVADIVDVVADASTAFISWK